MFSTHSMPLGFSTLPNLNPKGNMDTHKLGYLNYDQFVHAMRRIVPLDDNEARLDDHNMQLTIVRVGPKLLQ
jgi:hypothetical protein